MFNYNINFVSIMHLLFFLPFHVALFFFLSLLGLVSNLDTTNEKSKWASLYMVREGERERERNFTIHSHPRYQQLEEYSNYI